MDHSIATIPENLEHSIDHKKVKTMLCHTHSCPNACSELTHVFLGRKRVCIDNIF